MIAIGLIHEKKRRHLEICYFDAGFPTSIIKNVNYLQNTGKATVKKSTSRANKKSGI
jgi:hypothetical protein